MGTKKDIGKVFKEHFKDFEQTPDNAIWTSIASELDKKGGKKVVPLWYYFGGLVIIGLIGSLWFFTNNDKTIAPDTQNVTETQHIQDNSKAHPNNPKTTDTKSALGDTTTESLAPQKATTTPSSQEEKNTSTNKKTPQEAIATLAETGNTTSSNNNNTATRTAKDKAATITNSNTVSKSLAAADQPDVTVASIKKLLEAHRVQNDLANNEALARYKEQQKAQRENTLNAQRKESAREIAEQLVANQNKTKEDKSLASLEKETVKEEKKPKTDEDRKIDREESVTYEIAISPYTSLLSYGSLTKASSIDDRLVNNPRKAISTVGYGIRAEYTLSERARLRLGVGYTPLKYRTDNFQVSINNGSINIYELTAISGQALNQGGSTTENTPEALAFFGNNNVVSIQQDISYIEVPLDFQYMFINKRIGVSVSPGVSMLILNDNSIFATADNGQTLFIGKESNLSGLSLAFNLGVGAHYNLNSNWRFNMEPIFRYQINPYSNSTSNFRPYHFGVQFGASYKF